MAVPPLVKYKTEAEYRDHYERVYCRGPIGTFDGLAVRFRKEQFEHCFFESTRRNQVKDSFSVKRSERIDWIKAALQDPKADLFVGWDSKRKRHDPTHRVTVVVEDFVVVIRLASNHAAHFVTAYVADSESTLTKIRSGPRWQKPGA